MILHTIVQLDISAGNFTSVKSGYIVENTSNNLINEH